MNILFYLFAALCSLCSKSLWFTRATPYTISIQLWDFTARKWSFWFDEILSWHGLRVECSLTLPTLVWHKYAMLHHLHLSRPPQNSQWRYVLKIRDGIWLLYPPLQIRVHLSKVFDVRYIVYAKCMGTFWWGSNNFQTRAKHMAHCTSMSTFRRRDYFSDSNWNAVFWWTNKVLFFLRAGDSSGERSHHLCRFRYWPHVFYPLRVRPHQILPSHNHDADYLTWLDGFYG